MTVAYQQFESAPLIERLMREWRAAASDGQPGAAASALAGVPDPDAPPKARGCTLFDLVVERLAEAVVHSLRALISPHLDVEVVDVRAVATRAYLRDAPVPALLAPVAMGSVAPRGLILMALPLGRAMVDHLFGTGAASQKAPSARPFNATEQALLARIAQAILQDVTQAFAPVVPMACQMETQQAEAAETAVQVRLALTLHGQGGTVDLLWPHAALTAFAELPHLPATSATPAPVVESVAAPAPPPAPAAPSPWQSQLAAQMRHVALRVDMQLDAPAVPLGQVVAVRVGDILPLGDAGQLMVQLALGDVPLLRARLAQAAQGLILVPHEVAPWTA